MIELMIDLQGGAKAPLYERIYQYIRDEIVDGRISKGEKLPSTRLLSKNLGVSRSTAEMAYDQLFAEGYIESQPCRGYFVCDVEELYQLEQIEEKKTRRLIFPHIRLIRKIFRIMCGESCTGMFS